MPGPAEVSWAELALDYEAFAGREPSLPGSPTAGYAPAAWGVGPNPAQGYRCGRAPPGGGHTAIRAPLGRFRSLLPLGGRVCAGLSARPCFAARHEVMLQLMRLATHSWTRGSGAVGRRPACGRLWVTVFLWTTTPALSREGPPLLPYARRPPRAPPKSVPLAAPQCSRTPGAGSGTQGPLCLEHGAPLCPSCRSLGRGMSRCCRAGHKGHADPSVGPRCPRVLPRVAPGRQVLVPEDRRAGAAVLSSLLGRARPAFQALPALGPPASHQCTAPRRRPPSALGLDDSRPPKCPKPDLLADRGGTVSEGPARPGGGGADPFPPPPTAGDGSTGPAPAGTEMTSALQGRHLRRGAPPPPPPQKSNPPPPPAGGWTAGVAP